MRGIDSGGTGNFCGSVASGSAVSKPSGGIRSLHSLSAWGLPTPVVALACIGNVDIQVFSCAGGRLYFIRRLQVYLFIIFHVQPISQGVTLLFFFTEKKKRSKKRKEFALHLYYAAMHHPKITHQQKQQAACYPWADPPHKNLFAGEQDLSAIFINIHIN